MSTNNNSDTSARHQMNLAIEWYQNNVPIKEIESKLNINSRLLYYHLDSREIPRERKHRITPFIIQQILSKYKLGVKLIDIARDLNLNRNTISKILKNNGVDTSKNFERHLQQLDDTKPNLFTDLNNPDTQYWLGYLVADGCVKKNNTTISFTTKDYDLALAFINFTKLNSQSIYTYLDKRFNKTYYQVEFNNKKTCRNLISYGITANKTKSLNLKIPMTHNFLTGLLDGDGCVTANDLTWVTASKLFADQLMDFLINQKHSATLSCRNSVYTIRINKRKTDCEKLASLMYKDLTFYLQRKYIIFHTKFRNW